MPTSPSNRRCRHESPPLPSLPPLALQSSPPGPVASAALPPSEYPLQCLRVRNARCAAPLRPFSERTTARKAVAALLLLLLPPCRLACALARAQGRGVVTWWWG